ncbi:START-like domain containing protein [Parasponia andersonii]|uniref:START-like domain containing protein n=1 Tax=Parasponia andersonii TaxID=3476 RepID=A0A2P5BPS7_PARAD|nr:START-like domain containing protein [Parasponia andersonii]
MMPTSCSRAMKVVGMLEAFYEEIFELVMSKMELDLSKWDYNLSYGSLVKEVDGRTTVSCGLGDCLKVKNLNVILCDFEKWEAGKTI